MSSSIDCTVKVWDLKTKSAISSFIFPAPITSLAWDRTERIFFAASLKGNIHRINLFRKKSDSLHAAIEALGGGASTGEQIQTATLDSETSHLISVAEPITCMGLTINATSLLAGLASGVVNVYDVSSHQLLRAITTHKGQPMVMVGTIIRPPDLMGHVELGETSALREDIPIRPVQPFQRVRDPKARDAHEITLVLPATNIAPLQTLEETRADIMAEYASFLQDEPSDSQNVLRDRVSELEAELTRLQGQLSQAKNINDTMWETLAQRVLAPAPEQDMIPLESDNPRKKKKT